ncbi:hypothetical protein AB9F42_34030, partial [Rhizobium leguminosarum]
MCRPPVRAGCDGRAGAWVVSDGAGGYDLAVEEALRLKEAGKAEETLRTALAMGADRAILVETEDQIEPITVAKILKAVADDEQPGLIIV